MLSQISWLTAIILCLDLMIRLGLSVRVIMRRRPVGVTFSWLTIVLVFPFVGAIVYLLVGELRLGNRRAQWAATIHEPYMKWLRDLNLRRVDNWTKYGAQSESLARLSERMMGIPALAGNAYRLIPDWQAALRSITEDIDSARRTCHLEFYIWNEGGAADEVAEALIKACERGVICRVLIDAVGSREFLRSDVAQRLRDGGVAVQAALPAGFFRNLFVRFDLRLHRKIVVVDGRLAYTGSLNLVDPRYFKQDAGVGQWVDAMVRIEGPAVEGLAITFLEDWALESGDSVELLRETGDVHPLTLRGDVAIQVLPSGPAIRSEAIERVLLMAIYSAQRELILTTPYFVPDESLLIALMSAAQRGVDVTLIVPAEVDSLLVRLASQAFKGDLRSAGVRVALFTDGLLHTKSVTIDGHTSLFGSLNLDPRSLHLNFEITLAIYDTEFTTELRDLQQSYLANSQAMDLAAWQSRPAGVRFKENVARLLGPLL